MAQSQFLIRNRHSNQWYGRVIIPQTLRNQFNGKREFRRSLKTTDKAIAKRRALEFWVKCQNGFEHLNTRPHDTPFDDKRHFLDWVSEQFMKKKDRKKAGFITEHHRIEFDDVFGSRHVIDLGNAEKEQETAQQIKEHASEILKTYQDRPEILDRLFAQQVLQSARPAPPEKQPETPTPTDEAIGLYINKLITQGRKGKKLSERTLIGYQGRLKFWQEIFGQRPVHDITLKELSEIQTWMTRLPLNYSKKGLSTKQAVKRAEKLESRHEIISDKTRAEYLGQLKGFLEYAHSCGFITSELSRYVEIPNTKGSKTLERLPFTSEDLQKIFPANEYGTDFGRRGAVLDWHARYWLPLIALFSGARLEEITQLKTNDIKTCPDTGIIYMKIADSGAAGDGAKKHTKNKNSVRPIPVHSALIKIGFIDYVEKRKKDKRNKSLFKLKRDAQGRLGKGLSNWFSRFEKRKTGGGHILGYIERRGVISKGRYETGEKWTKTFHSFRHTAIDNLRGKQLTDGQFIREHDIGLVMGHEKGKLETANYGADRSQLLLRQAVIEAIEFEGINFKKLK